MKFNFNFDKYDTYEIDIKIKHTDNKRADKETTCKVLSEIAALLSFESLTAYEEGRYTTANRAMDAANSIYDAIDAAGYFDDVK